MSVGQIGGWVACALLSGSLGWASSAAFNTPPALPAAAPGSVAATPSVPPRAAQTSAPAVDTGTPLIAVAHDGTVTLRVEQQPLEWVLEQIAQQSGWTDVRARAALGAGSGPRVSMADATACPEPVKALPVAHWMQALERGSEADRLEGLAQLRSVGAMAPDAVLQTLYETDASDAVRLLAFENYLEPRSGDPAALRATLESALYVPNGAIQAEARRRLQELTQGERIAAGAVQQTAR